MRQDQTIKYPSQLIVDILRLTAFVISKTFWFVRYTGRENIPPVDAGGFLIVANHQTYIDPVWICTPMRRPVRYMAIEKAFGWRFVGSLIRYLGAFPVADDASGTFKAMREAIRSLRDGAVVTVFPEGAREFADGVMFPFKTGAARIASQAGVPILPVTIRGGNLIWPRGQRYPNLFRRVEVIYHPMLRLDAVGRGGRNVAVERATVQLQKIIASQT